MDNFGNDLGSALNAHRAIRDAAYETAAGMESAADATARHRLEVDSLDTAYRRLTASVNQAQVANQRLGAGSGAGMGAGAGRGAGPSPFPATSPMQSIGNLLMAARFGRMGMQPMVGQALGMMGIGGAAGGPVALLASGAIAAAQALYRMTQASAAATREFTTQQAFGGGSGSNTALLQSLGINGSAAQGLLARISSDSAARGVAARFGVSATSGPYGTMDGGGATLRILEGLRRESGEQQHRDLRILGMEGFAGLMKISGGTFDLLKRDSRITARIMDATQQKRGAEFDISGSRLGQSASNLTTALNGPVMRDFTAWQNGMANIINGTADWFAKNRLVAEVGWQTFKTMTGIDAGTIIPRAIGDRIAESQKGSVTDGDKATDENTEAIRRLTRTMEMSERGGRAIPSAVRGENFHRALTMGALRNGTL